MYIHIYTILPKIPVWIYNIHIFCLPKAGGTKYNYEAQVFVLLYLMIFTVLGFLCAGLNLNVGAHGCFWGKRETDWNYGDLFALKNKRQRAITISNQTYNLIVNIPLN